MQNINHELTWINSTGGPLIVLEADFLPYWGGCFKKVGESKTDAEQRARHDFTDYDRACNIADYLGIIDVGPGKGVVLGDEPMQTAWWMIPEGRGTILVRWQWAADEDAIVRILNDSAEQVWKPTGLSLYVSGSELVLFDSACAGSDPGLTSKVQLQTGNYSIETAFCQPDKSLSIILHRLVSKS